MPEPPALALVWYWRELPRIVGFLEERAGDMNDSQRATLAKLAERLSHIST